MVKLEWQFWDIQSQLYRIKSYCEIRKPNKGNKMVAVRYKINIIRYNIIVRNKATNMINKLAIVRYNHVYKT